MKYNILGDKMRKIIIFLLLLIFPIFGQHLIDRSCFNNTDCKDTLITTNKILNGRVIYFANPSLAKGSVAIRGWALKKYGTVDSTLTLKACMIYNENNKADSSEAKTIGTIIACDDTTRFGFSISSQSWWGQCAGILPKWHVAATGDSIIIWSKVLMK